MPVAAAAEAAAPSCARRTRSRRPATTMAVNHTTAQIHQRILLRSHCVCGSRVELSVRSIRCQSRRDRIDAQFEDRSRDGARRRCLRLARADRCDRFRSRSRRRLRATASAGTVTVQSKSASGRNCAMRSPGRGHRTVGGASKYFSGDSPRSATTHGLRRRLDPQRPTARSSSASAARSRCRIPSSCQPSPKP